LFWSYQVNNDTPNQVSEVLRTNFIQNDHHCKKRNQRHEKQAINENDKSGLFQVLELKIHDLAIDLNQRLLTTHGQHQVSETNENNDESQQHRPRYQVWNRSIRKPSQRLAIQQDNS